jgi:DNA (cytosine-5)-methyltransferase 1
MTAPPTVFDCFCGLGGLSIGADLAALDVVGGVDADPVAVEAYRQNFAGALALHRDLLKESPRVILKHAGIARGDIEILVGGPPCQPYSVNNHNRGTQDVRCGLVTRYLEFVSFLKPRWLVIENVPGFASIEGGKFLQSLLRSLRGRGYFTAYRLVDAAMFGVPQRRRRLVIVATRERCRVETVATAIECRKSKVETVGQAIGDLPEKPSVNAEYCAPARSNFQKLMREQKTSTIVNGHVNATLGVKNLKRIAHVPQGGNWRDVPRRLLPPGMKKARLSDHTTRYGRLHVEHPAFTLLTKCDPHWGCFVHPTQDRVITIREAARLQSIPDHVDFPTALTASYRLIGNAVPPLLAKGLFESIS